MTRRVAITGIGAVTPVGNDAESTWRVAGRRAQRRRPDHHVRRVDLPGADRRAWSRTSTSRERLIDTRIARHLSRAAGFGVARGARGARERARRSRRLRAAEERGVVDRRQRRPRRSSQESRRDRQHAAGGATGTSCCARRPRASSAATRTSPARDDRARSPTAAARSISVSTACTASAHAIGEALPPHPGRRGEADGGRRLRRAHDLARRARLLAARRAHDGVQRRAGARLAAVRRPPLRLRARRGRGRRDPRGPATPRASAARRSSPSSPATARA